MRDRLHFATGCGDDAGDHMANPHVSVNVDGNDCDDCREGNAPERVVHGDINTDSREADCHCDE